MTIDLVFVTYNRLVYTKLALASVLADPSEDFSLTIWDNASTDGTAEYLRSEVSDPRITDVILRKENVGQTAAVNQVWSRSKADLLGKLDNDCILTPGWTHKLAAAHADIAELGVVACWHYPLDEFDEEAAARAGKIQSFGRHQILRHPWTCGTGLLIKRDAYRRFGPMPGRTTTLYWLNMARHGCINGFYYPLIYQEHMDDPRSEHSLQKDDESIESLHECTVSLKDMNIRTMDARMRRRQVVLHNLLSEPWQAEHYVGCRGRLWRLKQRMYNAGWVRVGSKR